MKVQKVTCPCTRHLLLCATDLCSRRLVPVWLWLRSHSRMMMKQTYLVDICHARPSGLLSHLCSCLMCSFSSSSSTNTTALPSLCPNSLNANSMILSILVFVLVIDISPSVCSLGLTVDFYYDFWLIDRYEVFYDCVVGVF